MDRLSQRVKNALLVSTGMLLVGKKKATGFVDTLKDSGITPEEAEKKANEVLTTASSEKNKFIKTFLHEVKRKSIFATKDDINRLSKQVKEVSKKLDKTK